MKRRRRKRLLLSNPQKSFLELFRPLPVPRLSLCNFLKSAFVVQVHSCTVPMRRVQVGLPSSGQVIIFSAASESERKTVGSAPPEPAQPAANKGIRRTRPGNALLKCIVFSWRLMIVAKYIGIAIALSPETQKNSVFWHPASGRVGPDAFAY